MEVNDGLFREESYGATRRVRLTTRNRPVFRSTQTSRIQLCWDHAAECTEAPSLEKLVEIGVEVSENG